LFLILIAASAATLALWLVIRGSQSRGYRDLSNQTVSYKILSDDMGTTVRIGVPPDINEEQLRATLARVANEHQDDPARDYLTSMSLFVEAYLVGEEQRSTIPAGRLRRFVPPGNPASRRKMTVDREKGDRIDINLDDAKRALK
jgi:hypothetical protein